jgi:transcriptional regulator with XRE-family HTH domain
MGRSKDMKANNLAEYKEKKSLTSRELAAFLDVSESYLSEILSGKRVPSRLLAQAWSKKTGVPILNMLFPEPEHDAIQ